MSPETYAPTSIPPFKTCPSCGFGPERHSLIGAGDYLCHAGLDVGALQRRASETAPAALENKNGHLWLNGRVIGTIRNFSVGSGDDLLMSTVTFPTDDVSSNRGPKTVRAPNRAERRAAASFDRRQAKKARKQG